VHVDWLKRCGLVILVAIAALLTASCTAPKPRYGAAGSVKSAGSAVSAGSTGPASTGNPTTPTSSTTTTEEPGWTPLSYNGSAVAVDVRAFSSADGATVTVARFRAGQTRFDLHVGTQDPPTSTAVPPDSGPSVSTSEAPLLLGAFNGGFKMSAGAGGFEVSGQILSPLMTGFASFVIDASGTGHVGVWGEGLPARGEHVASVRQNLPPMVIGSVLSPNIDNATAWGSTLGGGEEVARSALGEDTAGDILYAGSMSALPVDIAGALVAAGAQSAMELDINPEWVQLALASSQGAALTVGIPGQNRPADQVVVGWTRDFVTVLSAQ